MTNAPTSIHAQYLVNPDPEIRDRALDYAAERGKLLWEAEAKVTSDMVWGFWTKEWTPRDRMAFLGKHPPFVVQVIDIEEYLEHWGDPEWLLQWAMDAWMYHTMAEPQMPQLTGQEPPEAMQQAEQAYQAQYAKWQALVVQLGQGIVTPTDVLDPYWSGLWALDPPQTRKMLQCLKNNGTVAYE